jgi:hypothetical protein
MGLGGFPLDENILPFGTPTFWPSTFAPKPKKQNPASPQQMGRPCSREAAQNQSKRFKIESRAPAFEESNQRFKVENRNTRGPRLPAFWHLFNKSSHEAARRPT